MKAIKYFLISVAALILVYFVGPTMPKSVLNQNLPTIQGSVVNYVTSMEGKPGLKIKAGCEAKIVWANDSTRQATEYVLLYLHGFSASWREGFPVNEEFAKKFGCNAFFARLAAHGEISDNPLLDMTSDRLYESAKEALVIAHHLGLLVVIMGCSTGCTLALKLVADFPGLVAGMILYSPNVQIKNRTAVLLSGHWGLQIAQLNFGGKFRVLDNDPNGEVCKYWNCTYRAEATVYLQQLLDNTMSKEQFDKVKCPVFVGYYYKDEQNQDEIVEVKASLQMFKELGTPDNQKRLVDFPNAGNHVLCSPLYSGAVPEVKNATFQFAEEILGMNSVQ